MPHLRPIKWFLLPLLLVVFLGAKSPERERRVALVIGNGAYQAMASLTNPPQDARDVGRKLESLGFEVTVLVNQGRAAMEKAVEEFAKRSKGANVALLYYSGHGIQVEGRNYLIPVEAEPPDDETGMHRQAVDLDWAVGQMTRSAKVSLIFMDACRSNPGLDQKLPTRGRDGTRDVRLSERGPRGTVQVLYAASRGQRALDSVGDANKKSRNSPFAEALLDHLADRDSLQNVTPIIIQQVKRRTANQQRSELQGNLDEQLYLAGKSAPVICPAGTLLTQGACQPVVNKSCPDGMRFVEGMGCVARIVPSETKPQTSPRTSEAVKAPTKTSGESAPTRPEPILKTERLPFDG